MTNGSLHQEDTMFLNVDQIEHKVEIDNVHRARNINTLFSVFTYDS